jgi:predicted RNA binding protein YcfA (HicA-like mRNA interferase family)
VAKAIRVLAVLERHGWVQVHRAGSHRRLERAGLRQTFSYHDRDDLGTGALRQVARDFGVSLEELRRA